MSDSTVKSPLASIKGERGPTSFRLASTRRPLQQTVVIPDPTRAADRSPDVDLDLTGSFAPAPEAVSDVPWRDVEPGSQIPATAPHTGSQASSQVGSPKPRETWLASNFGDESSLSQLPVCASVEDVPAHELVLTHGPSSQVKLPQEVASRLAALAITRSTFVWMLEESATLNGRRATDVSDHMRQAVGELRRLGYTRTTSVSGGTLRVTNAVFQRIVSNRGETTTTRFAGRHGVFWESMIRQAIHSRATDLHLNFEANQVHIRIRVDGQLRNMPAPFGAIHTANEGREAVSHSFNSASGQGGGSTYKMDEGREWIEPYVFGGQSGELRVTSIPGQSKTEPHVSVRIMSNSLASVPIHKAGFVGDQLDEWHNAARISRGTIFVSGPMGSGKTTTIDAFLHSLHEGKRRNVMAVEDPIEIRGHSFVHKVPLARSATDPEKEKREYIKTMKLVLRSDVQVVSVGEIRDSLSAGFAQQLSLINALVLSTLHVQSVSLVVPRLCDPEIGMSRANLSMPGILQLLVCQMLVPQLCGACKIRLEQNDAHPDASLIDTLRRMFGDWNDLSSVCWRNPKGCPRCGHSGVLGRKVVAEVWHPDATWLTIVRSGDDYAAETYRRSLSDGDLLSSRMKGKTLFEHGMRQVLLGDVDPEELLRFHLLEDYTRPPQSLAERVPATHQGLAS